MIIRWALVFFVCVDFPRTKTDDWRMTIVPYTPDVLSRDKIIVKLFNYKKQFFAFNIKPVNTRNANITANFTITEKYRYLENFTFTHDPYTTKQVFRVIEFYNRKTDILYTHKCSISGGCQLDNWVFEVRTCDTSKYNPPSCDKKCHCLNGVPCHIMKGFCPDKCDYGYWKDDCQAVCEAGKYWTNCLRTCSTGCNGSCDAMSAFCTCKPGYFGKICREVCGKCKTVSCHKTTGKCKRCRNGYTGEKCEHPCGNNRHGENCTKRCHCLKGETCNVENGQCPGACDYGYWKDDCQSKCDSGKYWSNCARNCATGCSDTCSATHGYCTCKPGYRGKECDKECHKGNYGTKCKETCGRCKSVKKCHHVTGKCYPGGCDIGYESDKCRPCTNNRYGDNCSKTCHCLRGAKCETENGRCPGKCDYGYWKDDCQSLCDSGKYSTDCSQTCSPNCKDTCERLKGYCICKSGYTGKRCNQVCPSSKYGWLCKERCGQCVNKKGCHYVTGKCYRGGCHIGYESDKCSPCTNNTYGDKCSNTCHCFGNLACNAVSGSCGRFGCALYYKGESCQKLKKCRSGYYGKNCIPCGNCMLNCSSYTNCEGNCLASNGICPNILCKANFRGERCDLCSDLTYGRKCQHACGKCLNDHCDMMTGLCARDCKPGYLGQSCGMECRQGYYGQACANKCSEHCDGKDGCSHIDGRCLNGCAIHWTGQMCDRPEMCKEINKYGPECREMCGYCVNDVCAKNGGQCTEGCKSGFTDKLCKTPCPAGYYGRHCTSQCGMCAEEEQCTPSTGECNSCAGYFLMPKCQICKEGYFGPECDDRCGHCKDIQLCDNMTGACPDGCASNFTGNRCSVRKARGLMNSDDTFYYDDRDFDY